MTEVHVHHAHGCSCGNMTVDGTRVNLERVSSLPTSLIDKAREHGGSFLKITQDAVHIRIPQYVEVTTPHVRCYRLVCSVCHQAIYIYTADRNAYVQFPTDFKDTVSEKITGMQEFLPFQIRRYVDFAPIQQPMASVSLPQEEDIMFTHGSVDLDYELMFGNYSECFVGGFSDVSIDQSQTVPDIGSY